MTEVDVLEFGAQQGNRPNAGNRFPRKMVRGIAIEAVIPEPRRK